MSSKVHNLAMMTFQHVFYDINYLINDTAKVIFLKDI